MKLRSASLAAVVAWGLSAMTANAVELRGFRGVPWGAAPDSLGAAAVVAERGEVRCYRRERENLLYGDSPIREVRFCFHRNHLFGVEIDSEVDQRTLRAEFQSSYGPPAFSVPSRASWGDQSTRARVEIVAPPTGSPASLHIFSNEFEPSEKHALQ
ncbi:MAG TPA: hypothetical protein VF169_00230 [Albitalea sp.]|uniref:hypothetical protein n=1 Tax=Piscinibacter sp. TaxID=1903157 RepID=UPI002ED1E1DA